MKNEPFNVPFPQLPQLFLNLKDALQSFQEFFEGTGEAIYKVRAG